MGVCVAMWVIMGLARNGQRELEETELEFVQ